MDNAPHLRAEDRREFERALDEALRTAHRHPGLSGIGARLSAARLRSMAVSAAVPIAACADTEYQRFVALRSELRHPSNAPSSAGPPGAPGAGLMAVVSVLAPLLAGAAAVIFLLVGYALRMLSPEPALAEPMRNAGWAFGVLAAATALLGMGGMLLTALRNGPSAVAKPAKNPRSHTAAGPDGGLENDVGAARAAWRAALLERGILPFLREALADPDAARRSPVTLARELPDEPRTPRLGYSHPGFSSPADRTPGADSGDSASGRPRYSSPEYASPDYDAPAYGGPEHQPD